MSNRSGATVRQWAMALLLAAMGQVGMPGAAQAAVLDTGATGDGVIQNFTGINWNLNGAAWVQGFSSPTTVGLTDLFTVTYQAFAGSIQTTTGSASTPNLYVASPGTASGTYELTTIQRLNMIASCVVAPCSTVSFTAISGSWNIYFDNTPDANQATGTGFPDGAVILAGTWDSGSGTFSGTTGNSTLNGTVTAVDSGYFPTAPLLTMLQINSLDYPGLSSFTRPASIDGVSTGSDTSTEFIVQVDPLQTFSVIPEPPTFALALIGILAMGWAFRRTGQQL